MKRAWPILVLFCPLILAGACAKEEPKGAAPAVDALHFGQKEDVSKKALEILNQRCTTCHGAERFSARAFTGQEWSEVVDKMVARGAKLSGEELELLRHWRDAK